MQVQQVGKRQILQNADLQRDSGAIETPCLVRFSPFFPLSPFIILHHRNSTWRLGGGAGSKTDRGKTIWYKGDFKGGVETQGKRFGLSCHTRNAPRFWSSFLKAGQFVCMRIGPAPSAGSIRPFAGMVARHGGFFRRFGGGRDYISFFSRFTVRRFAS